MTDSIRLKGPSNCLGSACLKWSADGELTALDLNLVMAHLAQVDGELAALHQDTPTLQPCPLIS